jgi:hypothetical protein
VRGTFYSIGQWRPEILRYTRFTGVRFPSKLEAYKAAFATHFGAHFKYPTSMREFADMLDLSGVYATLDNGLSADEVAERFAQQLEELAAENRALDAAIKDKQRQK